MFSEGFIDDDLKSPRDKENSILSTETILVDVSLFPNINSSFCFVYKLYHYCLGWMILVLLSFREGSSMSLLC